jgi:hypothetical protein
VKTQPCEDSALANAAQVGHTAAQKELDKLWADFDLDGSGEVRNFDGRQLDRTGIVGRGGMPATS